MVTHLLLVASQPDERSINWVGTSNGANLKSHAYCA